MADEATTELTKRLRQQEIGQRYETDVLLVEAADRIDTLTAENERLREAIERHAQWIEGEYPPPQRIMTAYGWYMREAIEGDVGELVGRLRYLVKECEWSTLRDFAEQAADTLLSQQREITVLREENVTLKGMMLALKGEY